MKYTSSMLLIILSLSSAAFCDDSSDLNKVKIQTTESLNLIKKLKGQYGGYFQNENDDGWKTLYLNMTNLISSKTLLSQKPTQINIDTNDLKRLTQNVRELCTPPLVRKGGFIPPNGGPDSCKDALFSLQKRISDLNQRFVDLDKAGQSVQKISH